LGLTAGMLLSQETSPKKSSYAPVANEKDFATVMAEMKRAKPELAKRHLPLLEERCILANPACCEYAKEAVGKLLVRSIIRTPRPSTRRSSARSSRRR